MKLQYQPGGTKEPASASTPKEARCRIRVLKVPNSAPYAPHSIALLLVAWNVPKADSVGG